MMRRFGAPEESKLIVQGNLASTYEILGRTEEASRMHRDVYTGHVNLLGEEHGHTLMQASNYARFLKKHEEYDKAKSLHRRTIPMARRALGDSNDITLRMRWLYANCLCDYKNATLDDLVEAVETLEAVAKLWKRVMGERHPETPAVLEALKVAREKLRLRRAAREVASD